MKKTIIILMILLISALLFCFYPRKAEHGVFISSDNKVTKLYIKNEIKEFNSRKLTFNKFAVVDFKYNLFKAYNFKEVDPIKDRIMIKKTDSYDIETIGFIPKDDKCYYYEIDKNNNIKPVNSKKILVGKNNVLSFTNKKKKLKTFLLYPTDYSSMRVGISTTNFSSIYHKYSEIKSSSALKIYNKVENFSEVIPANTKVTISSTDKKLILQYNESSLTFNNRIYLEGTNMTFLNLTRGIPNFTPEFDGILEFTCSKQGILIINELSLENYLTKVVPSEMPVWGGLEALKCQAIAARTYALSDMLSSRYGNLGFYVDDSTKSQVFNNIKPQELSNKAVEDTKGLVMTYNNYPIDAKYYSTSTGLGVNYKDIWFRADGSSDNKPYLDYNNFVINSRELPKNEKEWLEFYKDNKISSYDSKSPYYRWKIDYPKTALEKCLNASLNIIYKNRPDFIVTKYRDNKKEFHEFKNIKDINILKRSKGGNILSIEFIFENGSAIINADYNIRSAIRCSTDFTETPIIIERHDGSVLKNSNFLPSSFFSIEKTEDSFIIYGGGYGHGVGMSQYGAIAMSKIGMTCEQILNKFYKNIKIEKIY